ncbi:GAF domain-containing protein [Streptomyces sp. NPDC008238]
MKFTVRDTGVCAGAIYLMASDESTLRLEVTAGIPAEFLAPWFTVALSSPIPVAEVVHERQLFWIDDPQEFARRYPQMAIALPHHYAVAVAPILTGATAWGTLVLLWPRSADTAAPSRERVAAAGERLGQFLRDTADNGHALRPGPRPRTLPQPPVREREPAEMLAAADFGERLPEGSCCLDLEGRFTYLSATAAHLLGHDLTSLLGTRLWQSLPWCNDPAFEKYRSTVISRKPGYFTAMRPPDRWLAFELYPNGSGVSVRISPTYPQEALQAAPAKRANLPDEPLLLSEVYQVLHLAAALSQAVGVGDVVDMVTDQMMPAFGARTVALLAADNGRMRIIGRRGYSPWLLEQFDGAPLTSPTPPVRVLTTGVPSFFATFEELAGAYPAAPRQDGLQAWAFLPLIASGHPVGSCVLAFDQPQPFSENQRAVFTSLAGLIESFPVSTRHSL